jgi:hypothetical protein
MSHNRARWWAYGGFGEFWPETIVRYTNHYGSSEKNSEYTKVEWQADKGDPSKWKTKVWPSPTPGIRWRCQTQKQEKKG